MNQDDLDERKVPFLGHIFSPHIRAVSVERLEFHPPCGDSNQYGFKQNMSVEQLVIHTPYGCSNQSDIKRNMSVERLERSTNGLKGR